MNNITSFNTSTVRTITSEIDKALQQISQKYGVSISVKTSSYSTNSFNTKVSVATTENGVSKSPEATLYGIMAPQHGITANVGDWIVTLSGQRFKIIGWNTRAKRYPIMAEDGARKRYKLGIFSVRNSKVD